MPKAKAQPPFEVSFIAFLHRAPLEYANSVLDMGKAVLAHREAASLIEESARLGSFRNLPDAPPTPAAKKANGAAKPAPAKAAGKRGRPLGSANKPKPQSRVSVTGPDENEAWNDAPFQRNEEALAEHAGD